MASSSDNADSPPSYFEYDPRKRDDLRSIQKDCADISNSELARLVIGQPAAPRASVAQLRRFLLHVLHIDYFPEEKHYIAHEDETPYLEVASHVTDLRELRPVTATMPYAQAYCDEASDTVRMIVYDPARKMGVPERIVMLMIVRYAANLNESGTYIGCIESLIKGGCYRELCDKIRIDETVIIPTATPMKGGNGLLRSRLQSAAEEALQRYTARYREFLTKAEGACRYNGQIGMEPILTPDRITAASDASNTGHAPQPSQCGP